MEKTFRGKKVIITGGAGKIGKAISTYFSSIGASIIIADSDCDKSSEHVNKIKTNGFEAEYFELDLRSRESITIFTSLIEMRYKTVDILINIARPVLKNLLLIESFQEWDLGMDVLLKGPAFLSSKVSEMMKLKGGSIINISSVCSSLISHQPLVYHCAKAGLVQLTRWLAVELASYGISVNSISLGLVDIVNKNGKKLFDNKDNKKIAEIVIPGKIKAANEIDLAELIIYLSSKNARFITGQEIVIDGGGSLREQCDVIKRYIKKEENNGK